MLVTYAVIDDSPGLLKIEGLLCDGAFQKAVIADISVPGKISVVLIPFNTERNNALVKGFFSQTELEPRGRPSVKPRLEYIGDSTLWAKLNRLCTPLPDS